MPYCYFLGFFLVEIHFSKLLNRKIFIFLRFVTENSKNNQLGNFPPNTMEPIRSVRRKIQSNLNYRNVFCGITPQYRNNTVFFFCLLQFPKSDLYLRFTQLHASSKIISFAVLARSRTSSTYKTESCNKLPSSSTGTKLMRTNISLARFEPACNKSIIICTAPTLRSKAR